MLIAFFFDGTINSKNATSVVFYANKILPVYKCSEHFFKGAMNCKNDEISWFGPLQKKSSVGK